MAESSSGPLSTQCSTLVSNAVLWWSELEHLGETANPRAGKAHMQECEAFCGYIREENTKRKKQNKKKNPACPGSVSRDRGVISKISAWPQTE